MNLLDLEKAESIHEEENPPAAEVDPNPDIELEEKSSSPIKENLPIEPVNDPPVNLRLRITPSSNSPISLTLNDSDNNNNTNGKPSMDYSNDQQDPIEIINDDEELVEKIESVRNDPEGILFHVKLSGAKEAQWIPAKIANRKYPQAVIAFWENHVEFT